MDSADRADGSRANPLDYPPVVLAGVVHGAELDGRAGRPGHFGQQTHLADVVRERLLAVGVLSHFERRHRGSRVNVVGRGNQDGIEVIGLSLEHPAVVKVLGAFQVWPATFRVDLVHVGSHGFPSRHSAVVKAGVVRFSSRVGDGHDLGTRSRGAQRTARPAAEL